MQNSFDGQGGVIDPAAAAAAEGFRNIEGLEGKNITLKQKEDDNKLSFMRKGQGAVQSDSRIEEYEDRSGLPTRGQTMGVMSGMTAGSHTMGSATAGSGAHDSKMGTYSGMRHSSGGGQGSHSMRPAPGRSGMDAYQSTGGPTRLQYPHLM